MNEHIAESVSHTRAHTHVYTHTHTSKYASVATQFQSISSSSNTGTCTCSQTEAKNRDEAASVIPMLGRSSTKYPPATRILPGADTVQLWNEKRVHVRMHMTG